MSMHQSRTALPTLQYQPTHLLHVIVVASVRRHDIAVCDAAMASYSVVRTAFT